MSGSNKLAAKNLEAHSVNVFRLDFRSSLLKGLRRGSYMVHILSMVAKDWRLKRDESALHCPDSPPKSWHPLGQSTFFLRLRSQWYEEGGG